MQINAIEIREDVNANSETNIETRLLGLKWLQRQWIRSARPKILQLQSKATRTFSTILSSLRKWRESLCSLKTRKMKSQIERNVRNCSCKASEVVNGSRSPHRLENSSGNGRFSDKVEFSLPLSLRFSLRRNLATWKVGDCARQRRANQRVFRQLRLAVLVDEEELTEFQSGGKSIYKNLFCSLHHWVLTGRN